jgi:hypothetical protein
LIINQPSGSRQSPPDDPLSSGPDLIVLLNQAVFPTFTVEVIAMSYSLTTPSTQALAYIEGAVYMVYQSTISAVTGSSIPGQSPQLEGGYKLGFARYMNDTWHDLGVVQEDDAHYAASESGPALVAFKDVLYLAYRGMKPNDNAIMWATYSHKTGKWKLKGSLGGNDPIPSSTAPALSLAIDTDAPEPVILLTYKEGTGKDGPIRWSVYDGQSWAHMGEITITPVTPGTA